MSTSGATPVASATGATPVTPIAGATAVEPPEAKSRKGLLWAALAAVFAVFAAGAVYLFVIRDSRTAETDTASPTSGQVSNEQSGDVSASGGANGSEGSGSPANGNPGDGTLSAEQQTQVSALFDGYTEVWGAAANNGDFAPVAAYAAENAHPDFKPDQAQCLAYFEANGATKGYRQTYKVDMATVKPAPDWMPPGASEKPSGQVYVATAEHFAGLGLVMNPQAIDVYFAIADGKAYMFPTCS